MRFCHTVTYSELIDYLTAIENETYWLAHPITPDLNGRWSKVSGNLLEFTWFQLTSECQNLLSFTWSHLSQEGMPSSWCFRFPDVGAFQRFQTEYARCVWESTNKASWAKAKVRDISECVRMRNELSFVLRRTNNNMRSIPTTMTKIRK